MQNIANNGYEMLNSVLLNYYIKREKILGGVFFAGGNISVLIRALDKTFM